MPVRPDDAAELAKSIRDMYVQTEGVLLSKIARAIAKTADAPDWLTVRLQEQRRLIAETDRILAGLDAKVPGAVDDVVRLAYNRGVGFAVADADKAGLAAGVDLFGRVRDTGAEVALARAAIEPLGSMRFQIRRTVNDVYNQVTQQAAGLNLSGAVNRREASLSLLQRLAGQGIKGFTDRSGRQWEAGAYAEMAVRTATAQASLQGHAERLQSYGADLVIVSNAPEECSICRPYEGQVLSISGETTGKLSDGRSVYASLAEAKSGGLFHPNCRHSQSIYLEGITKRGPTDTADPEGDELRQKQRRYERRIRELKREKAMADELAPTAGKAAGAKLREKQAEFKRFRDANDRKTLTHRTNTTAR